MDSSSSMQYTILSMIIGIYVSVLLLLLFSSIILPSIRVWATEGLFSQHRTDASILFGEIKYKFLAAMCKGDNTLSGTFNQNSGVADYNPINTLIYNARGDEINSDGNLNEGCFFDQRINYSFHNNVGSFDNIKGINNNTDSFNNNTGSFNNDKNLKENIGSLNNNKGSFNFNSK